MGWNREKAARQLYRLGNVVVRVVGSAIFLALTWYAFRYTQYMLPGGAEVPVNVRDSQIKNLLALAVTAAGGMLFMLPEKYLAPKRQLWLCRIFHIVTLVWVVAASLWWIRSSAHVPVGDQAYIYGGASYFMEGNCYNWMGAGGYCGMYPYQLGLIALCEMFFHIVGAYNYKAFELVCVFLAAGSVHCGYRILSELTESTAAIIGYHILMMGCLPLIFYTPWVYGDIPGIFFALLAAWMLLRCSRNKKMCCLVVLAFSLVMGEVVRKHSMILMVAVGIAALLYALQHRDRKIIMAFLLSVLVSYASFAVIYKVYEIRSGYEHWKGIPTITWVTMGMQEENGACGWYNNYPKEIYYKSDCDREATAAIAKQDLLERLDIFRNDPSYALTFFRNKVLSQWNEPLYQALFFNAESPDKEGGPPPGSLAAGLGSVYYANVLEICDRWQFVIYAGMLCYFLFAVKKDSNILQHVLAITMIGGFFFSALFEAKARYILPYYVMMFPFAVYGYQSAGRKVKALLAGIAGTRNIKKEMCRGVLD